MWLVRDLIVGPPVAFLMDCWTALSFSEVLHRGFCLSRTLVEAPSSYVMLLIGLSQTYRFYVCQYIVFMMKLILSYLPVGLTYSLPSSPLKRVAVVELAGLVSVSWVCPEGLPAVLDR